MVDWQPEGRTLRERSGPFPGLSDAPQAAERLRRVFCIESGKRKFLENWDTETIQAVFLKFTLR